MKIRATLVLDEKDLISLIQKAITISDELDQNDSGPDNSQIETVDALYLKFGQEFTLDEACTFLGPLIRKTDIIKSLGACGATRHRKRIAGKCLWIYRLPTGRCPF